MGSCKSSWFLWLHIPVKPAAENPSFSLFLAPPVPIQPLDQDQGTSLLPSPPPPYVPLGPLDKGWWTPLWSWLGSGREPRSHS